MAPLEHYAHAHARLLGNKGALLDEFGDRAAADDCYARFEILSRLLGNDHRLANAVGLAARSALLRNDLATAEKKYNEEAQLASKVGDPLRKIAATLHLARLAASRGRYSEAENGFKDALRAARQISHEKRLTDTLESYAEFLRERRDLPTAYRHLREALALCGEPEKVANVNRSLARVCHDAGLYGESLEYLMCSATVRAQLYAQLGPQRHLGKARFDELKGLTKTLVDEALLVSRTPELELKLEALVNNVHGDSDAWSSYKSAAENDAKSSLWARHQAIRERSVTTWTEHLLPNDFSSLSDRSQAILERAERSYSSAVDDLGRSAHLLVIVIECVIKQRLFTTVSSNQKWMLGNMVPVLRDALSSAPAQKAKYPRLYQHIHRHRSIIERIVNAFDPIPFRGRDLLIVDIRNGVAHGDEAILDSLDRLQVDAIKRHLALEAPEGGLTIMQALARLKDLQ